MNPEIKQKWTEELRSGKYPQGNGLLRSDDDRFCCLGVLCEVAVVEGVIDPPELVSGLRRYVYDGYESAVLPEKVVEWAGLDRDIPKIGPSNAWRLNDTLEYSFEQIADEIDKYL